MANWGSHLSLAMHQELRWTSGKCPQKEGGYVSSYQDENKLKECSVQMSPSSFNTPAHSDESVRFQTNPIAWLNLWCLSLASGFIRMSAT
jgi:hypothetical protein